MQVGIYVRVSTKDQQNPDTQLLPLRDWCVKHGHQIVAEYIDRESGTKGSRAEFDKMFLAASQRRFDLCLFWSIDRFTREGARELLNHLNRLDGWGVAYRSYMEPDLDSLGQYKAVYLSFLGTFAKSESARISERVKAGMARAKRQNKPIGRKPKMLDGAKIQALRDEGLSYDRIGVQLGCTGVTIWNHLRAYHQRKAQGRVAAIPIHPEVPNHQTPSIDGSMNGAQASSPEDEARKIA
jgi:DNA invertase Pin-like site-specific DNA recombinase